MANITIKSNYKEDVAQAQGRENKIKSKTKNKNSEKKNLTRQAFFMERVKANEPKVKAMLKAHGFSGNTELKSLRTAYAIDPTIEKELMSICFPESNAFDWKGLFGGIFKGAGDVLSGNVQTDEDKLKQEREYELAVTEKTQKERLTKLYVIGGVSVAIAVIVIVVVFMSRKK